MEKIELLKKIIDDQAILINKLQGYLVSYLKHSPKTINVEPEELGKEVYNKLFSEKVLEYLKINRIKLLK